MNSNYLPEVIQRFEYYKSLGDKTFEQLSDEQLFWKANVESNSIANIVRHLWGNMLSRWTDFLTTDGEKEWRDREGEFADANANRAEMLRQWDAGWNCLFDALRSLTEQDLDKTIYIRNQGHTVTEAISRQLAHYASHVGQIIFIGKMLRGSSWKSLSIGRGESVNYNAEKFSQPKQ
ncbi:DUF1572 family protein [Persicitalea jodogahamensis]|uniref:DUF1572 domain-containing protein n=1 Tax=Persicitalea jodogahamensis TaxID=402147 RepID=A0A8J3D2R9_9BACT|nr:DUF1572 family protein [Persicitalea jodogahamensis]GHB71776.1 hypothetical protein GCM10007390_27090 [Persicitalea jodogahamensis]